MHPFRPLFVEVASEKPPRGLGGLDMTTLAYLYRSIYQPYQPRRSHNRKLAATDVPGYRL